MQNQNAAADGAFIDSRRVGYHFVYADDSAAAADRELIANGVGQVFGRFGAYDSTLKGARWKNAADTSAIDNYLQISVYPEDTFTQLTDAQGITIKATADDWETFDAPEPIAFSAGSATPL